MRFTYSSGQRPLDGFTIKRGVGKGGFGEVYFALSDGGKEVALKLVRGDDQVELRGVAQCLNLKHPNLVALYDLRTDSGGNHWVVMEYVAGEPLNAVMARHPQGLPRELAREWFLGLARAVGYLHDHGIVHRDLKPANLFLENGQIKVGDYGLSKSVSASQRNAHTQSVGTVHYMAPEIATGNYNKQVDTYAAGVILYEMVTGHVPFDGESAAEVLMKHLTSPPDLTKVPPEWKPILTRALSKNPAHRYPNMADMARDVEHVGEDKPAPAASPAVQTEKTPGGRAGEAPAGKEPVLTALPAVNVREQVSELSGSMALSVLVAGLGSVLWFALGHGRPWLSGFSLFFLTVAASWLILVPGKFWSERRGDSWTRRMVMFVLGGLLGLLALWLEGYLPGSPETYVAGGTLASVLGNEGSYFTYYALGFFALRWWRMTERRRTHRFSVAPILAAGFWGVVLMLLVSPQSWPGAAVLVMASAIVQLVSPWEPPPPPAPRRARLTYA
jgi:hypothetical protein